MAAILRAKVRRAIVRLHAFGQQSLVEIVERSLCDCWPSVAALLKMSFISWL